VVGLGSYGEYVITLGGELLQERPFLLRSLFTVHYLAVDNVDIVRSSVYLVLLHFLLTYQQILHICDDDGDENVMQFRQATASELYRAPSSRFPSS